MCSRSGPKKLVLRVRRGHEPQVPIPTKPTMYSNSATCGEGRRGSQINDVFIFFGWVKQEHGWCWPLGGSQVVPAVNRGAQCATMLVLRGHWRTLKVSGRQ
jgi:hypothetical protein